MEATHWWGQDTAKALLPSFLCRSHSLVAACQGGSGCVLWSVLPAGCSSSHPQLATSHKTEVQFAKALFPFFCLFSLPFSEENYFWPLEFIKLPNSDRFRVEGVIYDRWRIWMRPETVCDEEITAAVELFFEGNVYIHKSEAQKVHWIFSVYNRSDHHLCDELNTLTGICRQSRLFLRCLYYY